MNLATLDITTEQAEAALAEYRKMVADERTLEDEAIAQAYRAAARGLQVIRLSDAFRIAGRFPSKSGGYTQGEPKPGLPRLAIARADATQCHVRSDGKDWVFSDRRWAENRGALVGRDTVRVPDVADPTTWDAGHTIVPTIPPRHRPNRRRLHRHHVLWEVESWTPEPPRDPALIRHLRGDLWSVLAVWDLTDVERAVLAQRR